VVGNDSGLKTKILQPFTIQPLVVIQVMSLQENQRIISLEKNAGGKPMGTGK